MQWLYLVLALAVFEFALRVIWGISRSFWQRAILNGMFLGGTLSVSLIVVSIALRFLTTAESVVIAFLVLAIIRVIARIVRILHGATQIMNKHRNSGGVSTFTIGGSSGGLSVGNRQPIQLSNQFAVAQQNRATFLCTSILTVGLLAGAAVGACSWVF